VGLDHPSDATPWSSSGVREDAFDSSDDFDTGDAKFKAYTVISRASPTGEALTLVAHKE